MSSGEYREGVETWIYQDTLDEVFEEVELWIADRA